MSLITAVLTLIVVGVILWLINSFIPMDGKIKGILNFVVVVAVILWLLYGFGIIRESGGISFPKLSSLVVWNGFEDAGIIEATCAALANGNPGS